MFNNAVCTLRIRMILFILVYFSQKQDLKSRCHALSYLDVQTAMEEV